MPDNTSTTTVTNVSAAKPAAAGAVLVGSTSATLPTSVSAATTGFTSLGYISEDGLSNTNSPSNEFMKAWGGDVVLASQTERADTFRFKLIECLNPDVLKVVYKDADVTGSLDGTAGIAVKSSAAQLPEKAYIFDMIMRNDVAKRIVVPRAVVTSVGEVAYKDNEISGYEIEITALPDSAGYTHYEYIK